MASFGSVVARRDARLITRFGDDATHNGNDLKVVIDRDIDVEAEGGLYIKTTVVHFLSSAVTTPVAREDHLICNGTQYLFESKLSDDNFIASWVVRKK